MLQHLRPELLDDVIQELGMFQLLGIEVHLDRFSKQFTIQDTEKRADHVDDDKDDWPDNAEPEVSENGKENEVSGELSSTAVRE